MPFKNRNWNLQTKKKKIQEYICWKTYECKYKSTEGLNKIFDITEDFY